MSSLRQAQLVHSGSVWLGVGCVGCDSCFITNSSFAGQPDTFASSTWPRSNLPNSCAYQFNKFQSPTAPHIFPGKYTKLRYTQEQWQTLSMCMSTDAEVASYMFETGKADAEAWFAQDYPRYQ